MLIIAFFKIYFISLQITVCNVFPDILLLFYLIEKHASYEKYTHIVYWNFKSQKLHKVERYKKLTDLHHLTKFSFGYILSYFCILMFNFMSHPNSVPRNEV